MTQLVDRQAVAHRPLAPLPPDRLLELVRGLARDADTWRALARHDRDQRWFVRLTANRLYDAWLIGWHGYQGVDLHDHGGSAGALFVVEGELLETAGRLGVEGELHERRLTAGNALAFERGHVHWVVNPSPEIATSIHVYSPALTTMDFYETASDSSFRRLRTEAADPRSDNRYR
jgi:hypothetical protein